MKRTASALVYLMEELGDARMRCDQLVRYTTEASRLVEGSPQRDKVFELGGHLVKAIPDTLFLLQKALQAVALAATRMDYEELKQDLKPDKVAELERVLDDVRIRQVTRRSEPGTKNAEEVVFATGEESAALLGVLEGIRGAAVTATRNASAGRWRVALLTLSEVTDHVGTVLAQLGNPEAVAKSAALTREIRQTALKMSRGGPDEMATHLAAEAWKSDEARTAKFEEGKPADPTENMSQDDAAEWKEEHDKNKDNFKEAASLSPEVKLDFESAALALRNAAKGQRSKNNSITAVRLLASALYKMDEPRAYDVLMRAADTMQASGMWDLGAKTARFEEGKSADPTKHMSPEDAKTWKEEHEKNKDNFKSAAGDLTPRDMKPGLRIRSKDHPEWGDWKVDGPAKGVSGMWEISGRRGGQVLDEGELHFWEKTAAVTQAALQWKSDEARTAKFEEGKPADPTENMSQDDAAEWKEEHDKNKDNFKSAADMEGVLAGELREMQSILKDNGFNPQDAKMLQAEGMGPSELEHRIKSAKPGGPGSLEFTHGLKREMKPTPKATKLAGLLDKIAPKLFDLRAEVREAADQIHALYEDSSGEILPGAYANGHLKGIREDFRNADNAMGASARSAEFLTQVLKGKRKLP